MTPSVALMTSSAGVKRGRNPVNKLMNAYGHMSSREREREKDRGRDRGWRVQTSAGNVPRLSIQIRIASLQRSAVADRGRCNAADGSLLHAPDKELVPHEVLHII